MNGDSKMAMVPLFHSLILATCAVATIAVGMAGAAVLDEINAPLGKKEDRLAVATTFNGPAEVTVEQRGNGVSILTRMPASLVQ